MLYVLSLLIVIMFATGTVKGGTQLQTFVNVGRRTFASNNTLIPEHVTVAYITVIAVNAAGLRTLSYSDPIMIDLTKPECHFINDGPVLGKFEVKHMVGSYINITCPKIMDIRK
jgi:hypothetical protein